MKPQVSVDFLMELLPSLTHFNSFVKVEQGFRVADELLRPVSRMLTRNNLLDDETVAVRWVAEHEFVAAAVAAALDRAAFRAMCSRVSSKFPAVCQVDHPIACVALCSACDSPDWSFTSFAAEWDKLCALLLPANPNSQRIFSVGELTFRSDMECGNLATVEARVVQGATVYELQVAGDAGTDKQTWFFFSVQGATAGAALCFRINNLSPNVRLYRLGMKPVWRFIGNHWQFANDVDFVVAPGAQFGQLSFFVIPHPTTEESNEIEIAFTVPYTYTDLLRNIFTWHQHVRVSSANIRFEERVLCRTLDGRKLHLLIVTSQRDPRTGAPSVPVVKQVVLLSARVHPGEVAASHAMHGALSFLLSDDHQAAVLRAHFVFFIVPMLNPDGVVWGHTRLDQRGVNLNRCYGDPSPSNQPTVAAMKRVFDNLTTTFGSRIALFLDFHGQLSRKKAFVFGNAASKTTCAANIEYAQHIERHCRDLFDSDDCRFGHNDTTSKEGTSRVVFGSRLPNCFTVEIPQFSGNKILLPPHDGEPTRALIDEHAHLGKCCMVALLDHFRLRERVTPAPIEKEFSRVFVSQMNR